MDSIEINNEIVPMVYDILRKITMQVIVQGLVASNNPTIPFLSIEFIQITLFLILGTMFFWMIVYKYFSKNNIIQNLLIKAN